MTRDDLIDLVSDVILDHPLYEPYTREEIGAATLQALTTAGVHSILMKDGTLVPLDGGAEDGEVHFDSDTSCYSDDTVYPPPQHPKRGIVNNQPMQAPQHKFTIGRYHFGRYAHNGYWDISNGTKGTTGRSLVGTFIQLKRWERTPDTPGGES